MRQMNKKVLIDYLLEKVACEDWHGVADAAMDLRELNAFEDGRHESLIVKSAQVAEGYRSPYGSTGILGDSAISLEERNRR